MPINHSNKVLQIMNKKLQRSTSCSELRIEFVFAKNYPINLIWTIPKKFAFIHNFRARLNWLYTQAYKVIKQVVAAV